MATIQTARLEMQFTSTVVQTSRVELQPTAKPNYTIQMSRMELAYIQNPLMYAAIGGVWVGVTATKTAVAGVWT